MKLLVTFLLLAELALPQGVAPPSQPIPVDQENSRKAKTILDAAIQALGGQAYLNIQDIAQEGRTFSFHHGQPNSFGVRFWRSYKYPDKDRVELTPKRDVVYVYKGDNGYEVTFKGTRPLDTKELSDYLRRQHYALDRVLRQWLTEPRVALFYEGQAVTEGKSVNQVTVMNAKNEGVTLYIDSNDHLPVKKTFSWRDPTDKERNIEEEIYDNYRPVQNIMTPHTVTRTYNGDMANQRFLTAVTYNQGVSDSKFEVQVTYDPNKGVPAR